MMKNANITLVESGPPVKASFSAVVSVVSDDIFFALARLVMAVGCVDFGGLGHRANGWTGLV